MGFKKPVSGFSIPQTPPPKVYNFHDHIPTDVQRRAIELFKSVDLNSNGLISRYELVIMLVGLTSSTNIENDLNMWFKNADYNHDKQIDKDEFINIFGYLNGYTKCSPSP